MKMHNNTVQGMVDRVDAFRFGFATEASADDMSNSKMTSSSSSMCSSPEPCMSGMIRRLTQKRAITATCDTDHQIKLKFGTRHEDDYAVQHDVNDDVQWIL
jgi:hypothetical protein